MSEMVERLARVIASELGDDFDSAFENKAAWIDGRSERGGRFRDVNEPTQADYIDAARAVIQAMKEPTQAQFDALSATDKLWRELDSRAVYEAMIDGALR